MFENKIRMNLSVWSNPLILALVQPGRGWEFLQKLNLNDGIIPVL